MLPPPALSVQSRYDFANLPHALTLCLMCRWNIYCAYLVTLCFCKLVCMPRRIDEFAPSNMIHLAANMLMASRWTHKDAAVACRENSWLMPAS